MAHAYNKLYSTPKLAADNRVVRPALSVRQNNVCLSEGKGRGALLDVVWTDPTCNRAHQGWVFDTATSGKFVPQVFLPHAVAKRLQIPLADFAPGSEIQFYWMEADAQDIPSAARRPLPLVNLLIQSFCSREEPEFPTFINVPLYQEVELGVDTTLCLDNPMRHAKPCSNGSEHALRNFVQPMLSAVWDRKAGERHTRRIIRDAASYLAEVLWENFEHPLSADGALRQPHTPGGSSSAFASSDAFRSHGPPQKGGDSDTSDDCYEIVRAASAAGGDDDGGDEGTAARNHTSSGRSSNSSSSGEGGPAAARAGGTRVPKGRSGLSRMAEGLSHTGYHSHMLYHEARVLVTVLLDTSSVTANHQPISLKPNVRQCLEKEEVNTLAYPEASGGGNSDSTVYAFLPCDDCSERNGVEPDLDAAGGGGGGGVGGAPIISDIVRSPPFDRVHAETRKCMRCAAAGAPDPWSDEEGEEEGAAGSAEPELLPPTPQEDLRAAQALRALETPEKAKGAEPRQLLRKMQVERRKDLAATPADEGLGQSRRGRRRGGGGGRGRGVAVGAEAPAGDDDPAIRELIIEKRFQKFRNFKYNMDRRAFLEELPVLSEGQTRYGADKKGYTKRAFMMYYGSVDEWESATVVPDGGSEPSEW